MTDAPLERSDPVLIVGGGIAGLSLAAGLARAGFAPEIAERAASFGAVGAGIVLSANAMTVLERLGLAAGVREHGRALCAAAITDARGGRLACTDLDAFEPRFGPTLAIHRADLHAVLLRGCAGLTLRAGTTVRELADRGARVEVALSDGSRAEYALVVGADGIRSQVRSLVFGPSEPRYAGYTCWRFVARADLALAQTVEMWGRGLRLGLVPLPAARVYGFAVANAPAGRADPEPGRRERLQARFARFRGAAPSVLESLRPEDALIHDDLADLEHSRWHRGRVVLVGDAAHAATPNLGQGAAMALEDAAVLVELLSAKRRLDETLAGFERRREPRVRFVRVQSSRLGRLGQLEAPLACAVRDAVLRALPDRLGNLALERLLSRPI